MGRTKLEVGGLDRVAHLVLRRRGDARLVTSCALIAFVVGSACSESTPPSAAPGGAGGTGGAGAAGGDAPDAGLPDAADDAAADAAPDAAVDAAADAAASCPTALLHAQVSLAPNIDAVDDGGVDSPSVLPSVPRVGIALDGTGSTAEGGSISSYHWLLESAPQGSTATLPADPDLPQTNLWLDERGDYQVALHVEDDQQQLSCNTARITIQALVDLLHVQLVWHTPADPDETDPSGTDLDVHLYDADAAGGWSTLPADCFSLNPNPDWGVQSYIGDDPRVDRDDVDGAGPENINLNDPQLDHSYEVGVYFHDEHGFGPTQATVRIYVRGALQLELAGRELSSAGEFWHVASIYWRPDDGADIAPIDQVLPSYP